MSKALTKKLLERQKKLSEKGGSYRYFILKDEGQVRMRPLFCGEDKDWAEEVVFFFLGKNLGGYISPASIGQPCPLMKFYEKLNNSSSDKDREFAKRFRPKKRFMVPHILYKDMLGKEVDEEKGVKMMLLTDDLYSQLLELYLDPDNGDFTDPIKGYDIKYKRTGKGQMDTKYSLVRCNKSKVPQKYRGPYNTADMLKALIPTADEAKSILAKFKNSGTEEAETPTMKKKKKKVKSDA